MARLALLFFACAVLLVPIKATAVQLDPGDIIVTDPVANAVVHVDPVTGAQTLISSGGILEGPHGIALTEDRQIFVAGGIFQANGQRITHIDRRTGEQVAVSENGLLTSLRDIASDSDGSLLVAQGDNNSIAGLIRVDPTTGAQLLFSPGGSDPSGVAVTASGQIFVVDQAAVVFRVDASTGEQTTVTAGGLLAAPIGIAIGTDGRLFVADEGGRQIVRVDPLTGSQTLVTSFPGIPFGIATECAGTFIVTDTENGRVIRIDPSTGSQSVVSSGGFFQHPTYVEVVRARGRRCRQLTRP
jgi:streptogramin lyase